MLLIEENKAVRRDGKGADMKLSSLRSFLMIVRYGGFTKASERLFISQPTLSRQIQELEKELGVQLFLRDHKTLTLTAEGRLLCREAEAIIERCDRLPQLFHPDSLTEKSPLPGSLHVGMLRSFNTQHIYQVLAQLRRSHPEADIMLTQDTVSGLKQGLSGGKYDAVVTLGAYCRGMKHVSVTPLCTNRLLVVVAADHPLVGRDSVSIGELENEDFLLLNRAVSPIIVDWVIGLCVTSGFSPDVSHYINTLEEGLELAAAGKGISFIHSEMLMDGLEQKYNVRFIGLSESQTRFSLVLASPRQLHFPMLDEMIGMLEQRVAERHSADNIIL